MSRVLCRAPVDRIVGESMYWKTPMKRDLPHHSEKRLRKQEFSLSDNPGAVYLSEIRQYQLLNAEEEISLAQCVEAGRSAQHKMETADESPDLDRRQEFEQAIKEAERARSRLIECNLRLVVFIARQYLNRGLLLADLIQEGNIGLHQAVDRYDWRRGFRFSTYAYWWIRQAMVRSLADQSRTIRLPVHVVGLLARVTRAERDLQASTGAAPTVDAVAEALGMAVDQVAEVHRLAARPVSIDAQVAVDSETTWGDLISDDVAGSAAQREIENQELSKSVGNALELLDRRERQILQMRFGLSDGEERSLVEIAEILGMSRERVRTIEQAALTRLRYMPRFRDLMLEYLAA
jgi:RNA polymerase primary sigma factor